jgi:hypothetical protein
MRKKKKKCHPACMIIVVPYTIILIGWLSHKVWLSEGM